MLVHICKHQSNGGGDGGTGSFAVLWIFPPAFHSKILWLPVGLCLWYIFSFLIGLKRINKKIGKELTRKIARSMSDFFGFCIGKRERESVCVFDFWFACAKSTSYNKKNSTSTFLSPHQKCKINLLYLPDCGYWAHIHKKKYQSIVSNFRKPPTSSI